MLRLRRQMLRVVLNRLKTVLLAHLRVQVMLRYLKTRQKPLRRLLRTLRMPLRLQRLNLRKRLIELRVKLIELRVKLIELRIMRSKLPQVRFRQTGVRQIALRKTTSRISQRFRLRFPNWITMLTSPSLLVLRQRWTPTPGRRL